jgi:hypothetical protein
MGRTARVPSSPACCVGISPPPALHRLVPADPPYDAEAIWAISPQGNIPLGLCLLVYDPCVHGDYLQYSKKAPVRRMSVIGEYRTLLLKAEGAYKVSVNIATVWAIVL